MSSTRGATQEEVRYRISVVAQHIARGTPRADIVAWVRRESGWDIGDNQAYNYIKKAWELIREIGAVNLQQQLGKALFDLNYLYKQALEDNDLDLALKVRKELSDTLGLKKQTIRFETGDGDEENLNPVEALISQITNQKMIEDEEMRRERSSRAYKARKGENT